MTPDDVLALLARARDGDESARERLFAWMRRELRPAAERRAAGEADDLLQDTALKLWRAWDNLRSVDFHGLLRFLNDMLETVAIDRHRKRSARRRGGEAVHESFDDGLTPGRGDTPSEAAAVDEAEAALLAAVAGLPRELRGPIKRLINRESQAAIAAHYGCSEATISRRIGEAKRQLAERLGGQGHDRLVARILLRGIEPGTGA